MRDARDRRASSAGEAERAQATRDETAIGIEQPHEEQRHRDPRDDVRAEDRAAHEREDAARDGRAPARTRDRATSIRDHGDEL